MKTRGGVDLIEIAFILLILIWVIGVCQMIYYSAEIIDKKNLIVNYHDKVYKLIPIINETIRKE